MKKKKEKRKIKVWEGMLLMVVPAILITSCLIVIQEAITTQSSSYWDFMRFSIVIEIFILVWIINHEKGLF